MKMKRQTVTAKYRLHDVGGGFTLVEILAVVVLIVLISSVGGGIYVGTHRKALAEKSARDFLLAAQYARILAIERQSRCRLKLDAAENGFTLTIDEFNNDTKQTEQVIVRDLYFKPVQFAGKVKFESIRIETTDLEYGFGAEGQNTITFSSDGTAQGAVVQIGDGENHYTARISASTGKAKIYAGTAKTVKSDTIDLDQEQG